MFPACFSSFFFLNPGITQFVFMNERCEVSVLKNNKRETGEVRKRVGVIAGGGGVRVRAAASSPLPLLL